MPEHNFTLVLDGDVEEHLDALFEAGCDDATFGDVDGVSYAEFDREGPSLIEAVGSALRDVESVPGIIVARIEPDDLVTASEIAERLGRTRQSVQMLIAGVRGAGDFPSPATHSRDRNRMWRWSDIAAWSGDDVAARDARMVAGLNAALELRSRLRSLTDDERRVLREGAGDLVAA